MLDAVIKARDQEIKMAEVRLKDEQEAAKRETEMYKALLSSSTTLTKEQMQKIKQVKEERNQTLLAVVNELAVTKNQVFVGTRQQVLCTGPSKTNKSRLMGRTPQNKVVIFDGDADRMTGEIFDVLIEDTTGFSLYGTPVLK